MSGQLRYPVNVELADGRLLLCEQLTHDPDMPKHQWGAGPWLDEPDKIVWIDETTKLDCMIRRSTASGTLCGYVGVPPGHPWHGHHYENIPASVHGGLTFSEECQPHADPMGICHTPRPGRPADVWWLGFDCGHGWDFMPALPRNVESVEAYRTLPYVVDQVEWLCAQVRAADASAEDARTHYVGDDCPGGHRNEQDRR